MTNIVENAGNPFPASAPADSTCWNIAACVYGAIALVTLLPVLIPMLRRVNLYPGGPSYSESQHFSENAKKCLNDHYERILGTLGFWKSRAKIHRNFHYYCICWTIISSWLVPLIGSIGVNGAQKWFLVTVSSHVALALSFHRGLKIHDRLRAYRLGESEFYDLHRRLLDRPNAFGATESAQLDSFFAKVEDIRRRVRSAEADSMPNIDQGEGRLGK